MRRETERHLDNRAVTPWFRAFGGALVAPDGDAVRLGNYPGSHRLEWRLLSAAIPLVMGAACFDGLWRLGGVWLAVLAVVPVLFFLMQGLAFGMGQRTPAQAFWLWSLLIGVWAGALLRWGGETPVRWVAVAWLAVLALQLPALLVLGWRSLMAVSGPVGIRLRVVLAVLVHLVVVLVWWQVGWIWGLLCGAMVSALWVWGTFLPTSVVFGPVARRVCGPGMLLTIDDGPDPDDTPVILDLLDKHGVKAVFFVIGEKVREFPELTREIVARGHELGNHTMTHPQASMWVAGPGRTRRELEDCSRVIEEVAGRRPRWFRAPVGHFNYFVHPIAEEMGMEAVAWSHRAYDTVASDVDLIVRKLTEGTGDGDVLLIHESTPVAKEVVEGLLEEVQSGSSSFG